MTNAADRFDRGMGFFDRAGLLSLRRQLVATAGGDVLEIGAGTGLNLDHYPSGARVTAVDLNPELLALIPDRRPDVPVICADIEALPLGDSRFDLIVGSLVFCSIVHPERALAEIRRVLRPDGRLLLLEHVRGDGRISRRLTDWLHPFWFALQGECHLNRETATLVREAGFKIRRTSRHAWGVLQMIEAHHDD